MKYTLASAERAEMQHARGQLAQEAGCVVTLLREKAEKCRNNGLIITLITPSGREEMCYVPPGRWEEIAP